MFIECISCHPLFEDLIYSAYDFHIYRPRIQKAEITQKHFSLFIPRTTNFSFLFVFPIPISIMYKQILSNVFCKYFCNGKNVSFYSYRGSIFCIKCMISYFNFIWFILLRYRVLYLCISSKGRNVEGKVFTLIITSISKTHRVVLHKISIGNNVEVCCECMNCIRGVRTQNKRKGEKCDSVVVSYFELYSINWYSVPSCIWGKFKAQTESRINNRVAAWSYLVNIHKNINWCTKYFLASYELY